ncbi:MAG: DsrE family protein [bacterium]
MRWVWIVLMFLTAGCGSNLQHGGPTYPDGSRLQVRENVRVVYGVGGDAARQGVGEGLFFARRLVENYEAAGIDAENRTVVVVLYNAAAYWLLNADAWKRAAPTGALAAETNPNEAIVAELLERGVHIEVCGTTLKKNKWRAEDLLPGVVVVPGAYARIVDLQQQGFAYVAFDRGTP